ncbi:CpsD/CapB family tyrosine-protein kinase [Enterococcus ratti]|uniref:Tyrosine-protein kinase CpsD n=1 Tax=Enterococcus ratti TaxID=150033 RepID=A0A1L8WPS3_9ENTE|nr:CpsD/CapB family tyrosine-protein kinase [Enterococcus ratti]OJG82986.1 capsular exopolysaccharide family protein [Enterococcus ratti]
MKRIIKRRAAQKQPSGLVTVTNPFSGISEQYRTIRTNIQFVSPNGQQTKTIVVTSSEPEEGKSTTVANLAVVFAKSGQKVLVIDADMRKPALYKTFQLDNGYGLSNILSSNEAISEGIQKTPIDHLSVLPSGPTPSNPSELLSSQRMDQLLVEVRQFYDIVMIDVPPVVAVTDAQIVASKVDGTLLVVRESASRKESLLKAKKLLEIAQANMLGIVYNGAKQSKDASYYYYGN